MKDFRLFDISDFVMDEDFIRWVHEKNKTDNDFWNDWLRQNQDKYMAVAEARRILESIGTEQNVISDDERQQEIDRLLNTIRGHGQKSGHEAQARVVKISKKWWYAAATLLFALLSTATYFMVVRDRESAKFSYDAITPSKRLIENINTSEKAITLRLPDESTVELAANSRIAYANNFGSTGTRDVYLSGEGFFKVTKNPARPFRVFANEIVTKVLGTSFIVRSFEQDTVIQVTVRTGKVSVYSQAANARETSSPNQLGGIILTPNQELVYQKAKQKFRKGLLENPQTILPDSEYQKNSLYEDVPLEKVFTQLSKIYGVSIVYDTELLEKCTVTADLRNETFYTKLELICKAIGARYEIIDGQVVIQTSGCN